MLLNHFLVIFIEVDFYILDDIVNTKNKPNMSLLKDPLLCTIAKELLVTKLP